MKVLRDPLYRNSLLLLCNTAVVAIVGLVAWTFTTRHYPAPAVGSFAGLTFGISLIATISALGLPNMIMRHLVNSENPRGLLAISLLGVACLGTALGTVVILGIGPILPASLHLRQQGSAVALFVLLMILTAMGSVAGQGLVAVRASRTILWTNLVGSLSRLAALVGLDSFKSTGLIISYSLSLILTTGLSIVTLSRKLIKKRGQGSSLKLIRDHISITFSNYIATILGILPSTVVPLEVLSERGAAQTASFSVAFLIASFLNFIPSTTSAVLFAEASRKGVTMGTQLRKAIRAIYALLLPALLALVPSASLIMSVFGATYEAQASNCLRILALTALVGSGNYLVDSMLIARDRSGAYLFMNGVNAALVLGCVGVLLKHGLTWGAIGWALAQAVSFVLALIVVVMGRTGRHRRGGRLHMGPLIAPDTTGVASLRRRRVVPREPLVDRERRGGLRRKVLGTTGHRVRLMKILVFPWDSNPYQRLLYEEMERSGAKVARLGRLTPIYSLNLALLPLELIARKIGGWEIVHLHWVWGFSLPAAHKSEKLRRASQLWFIVCLNVIRRLGLRLAWTAHNVLPHDPVFADDVAARRALARQSDVVFGHSTWTFIRLAEIGAVPRHCVLIRHPPFDRPPVQYLSNTENSSSTRKLLFFGKIVEYKGVEELLEAFRRLPISESVHLTIAGFCANKELRSLIERAARDAEGRISLRLQHIPAVDIGPLMASADVVVLPFRRVTTSGSSVLALNYGKPIVIPKLPGLADLPDDAVFRYDGSVEDLTATLRSVIDVSGDTLARMSAAAMAYSSETTWHELASATLAEFSKVLR